MRTLTDDNAGDKSTSREARIEIPESAVVELTLPNGDTEIRSLTHIRIIMIDPSAKGDQHG